MSATPLSSRAQTSLPRRTAIAAARWAVWSLPARTVVLVLGTTLLALAAVVQGLASTSFSLGDLLLFAGLLAAGALSLESVRRVPEPAGGNTNDMLAAWCVPVMVLLPPVYSLAAAGGLMLLTQWRVSRIAVYKRVYSAAAIGLSHAAGSAVFAALPAAWRDWDRLADGAGRITVAVLAVAALAKVLNAALIAAAVVSSDLEARWRDVLVVDGGRLEVTEVCTGVLIAVSVGLSPVLALVALPPVLLLQRGMLYAQLKAAARTDGKTGLLNAGTWEREAAAALRRAGLQGKAASVLLLDIDHFKQVNDTHGHLAGDDVLRCVAGVLSAQLRDEQDLVCRFGGEEFAVLLPGVDSVEAALTADRLRGAVASSVTPVGGTLVQVTVSIGVAAADPATTARTDVQELLARADLGLYRAKTDGRNQVRLLVRPDRRTNVAEPD